MSANTASTEEKFVAGQASKWDNPPEWYDMKENLALDKYEDNVFPGALLIALNAGPDPESINTSNKVNLAINCIQAVNLPPLDDEHRFHKANSDPYCEIIIEPKKREKRQRMRKVTKTCRNTLNPIWKQKFKFDNVEIGDTLSLCVWDKDSGDANDDVIGHIESFQLPGKDEKENYKNFIGRHWFNLKANKEEKEERKIKLDIRYTATMKLKEPERKNMQLR